MYQYILPDAGEGTHESVIMSWASNVGDKVIEDQTLLEIESDKAVVELPSPITGYLAKIYVEAGETGIVGQPIAEIAESEKELKTVTSNSEKQPQSNEDLKATPEVEVETKKDVENEEKIGTTNTSIDVRQLAVPRVRKYARTKQVDLSMVEGTGNHGKITIEDIDRFLTSGQNASQSEVKQTSQKTEAPSEETESRGSLTNETYPELVEKIPAIRRTIADALAKSSQEVAQVTVFDQVEVDALVAHRNKMKEIAKQKDIKLTFTPYLVKALVGMLKRFPDLNVSIDMDKNELSHHQYYNIGVATDTPRGLMVPMIRHAERKSLFDIAQEITAISEKAREGKLSSSDMGKGSISLTNVGAAATAGVWSTPIINLPEVAILNVGRIDKVFLPDEEGNPVLKNVMKISFAFDHRAVDGVYVQKAINLLKSYLNDPDLLLAEG
ncbi:hypothetical protein HMPREF9318_01865 [Streptococcus urinalis FB127-CNA-2]|uniref:Dihydrolipoamide acetyltransferase component of pyruvate dehydrogenase complex n=1 Tax=Streptococcus urinalis 2285-97 TaxID=764291 RepID=G5KDH0_9STRE|nr:dihydrolipoamide acetyltransferase family protein [Streptococcus urinalis]EHJ56551.1 dihydrolipoyllysine-residue acetyltransferase component of pyruvate dehydrogenase complex [Streptococcus urinalis 2285-97]EKS17416.1 hypothetical protein HMPREF9318_01865 [Streptococcus urinalis FB127-CNA-2]VEF32761.1 dihydrolipoyllysine-residue acetyltransferase component of acetoin cleaving system [Streptococcus urinalis]